MITNVHGKQVNVVIGAEIRKSLEAGEDMKKFGVRMAVDHGLFINSSHYRQVKQKFEGTDTESQLRARIAELEKSKKK